MADTIFYYNNGDPTSSSDTIITQSSYNRALSLNSVTIGDSVTLINNNAFSSSAIENITISSSVTFIGANAFLNCFSLKNVIINENNLRTINLYAFGGCIALENINLPNSVTFIGVRAFTDCYQLTSFNISSNVTYIGERAFNRNRKIINFNVDPNNPNYSSDADGVLFNKNKTSLINYPLGSTKTSYIIPSSVVSIEISAFFDAQYITKIIIPDNVTSIGDNAFSTCTFLTDVTIGKGITTIPYRAFYYCSVLSNLIVEKNTTNLADQAFQGAGSSSSFKCYFKGDAPTLGGPNVFDSSSATIYRYSIRSGWSSTLGGRPVVTIGPSVHKGLQTFGFPNISSGKISIKKQNLGSGKIKTYSNLLSNSRFDKDNNYPYAGYDANYSMGGWANGGSLILSNYYHNSPVRYDINNYFTIANKTFHQINSPYNILPLGHPIQPRLLKMFGAGSKFGSLNNTNYLKTITSTTSFIPTDDQSWTKYGVEQIIAIPSWARKVKYGVKYLIINGDEFRFNNFGGLAVYFQKGMNRSYVNLNIIRKSASIDTTALDSLETLYTLNNYVNFNMDAGSNAVCQWLGPQTSKVKVRRRPSIYIGVPNLDVLNILSDTIDIPTFSSSGGTPDANNDFPDYVSIQMFFAEWVSYLNNSGIQSGAIYFYEPFLYFTEF
jgi:BspA type Leucine rich repeat region (6 copies)